MKIVVVLCTLFFLCHAQAAEFDRPWNDANAALVIDPYYGNEIDWEKLATEPRVVAIVHKATVGTVRIDPAYLARKEEAKKRGYLWGSYHWGVAGEPEKQADYYIDTVKPGVDELIALDLEDANSTVLMNAEEALRFISRVKERTGRYPVLYTNHASAKLISTKFKGTAFAVVPLWYARFKATVGDFPMGVWPTYTLWQFSSEILPQIQIPGIKSDMDVNVFNGSAENLKANWPLTENAITSLDATSRNQSPPKSRASVQTGTASEIDAFAKKIEKPLQSARYMEGLCSPTQVKGWDGFATTRCMYKVSDRKSGNKKTGLVILLDPPPRLLAAWIINACAAIRPTENALSCAERLFRQILRQSGGQFPVAGIVYEDVIPYDGVQEAYGFSNGVTAILSGIQHRSTKALSSTELEAALSAEPLKTASEAGFARIVGVSRAEYSNQYPMEDVTELKWLNVVREEHKKAMKGQRNALIEVWLGENGP